MMEKMSWVFIQVYEKLQSIVFLYYEIRLNLFIALGQTIPGLKNTTSASASLRRKSFSYFKPKHKTSSTSICLLSTQMTQRKNILITPSTFPTSTLKLRLFRVVLYLIQFCFKQMVQLKNPETVSAVRILEIANQPDAIQAQYIDLLHLDQKSRKQMLYLFAAIGTLTNPIHLNFKMKILSYANLRAKQLNMEQVQLQAKQKYELEKQKKELEKRKQEFNKIKNMNSAQRCKIEDSKLKTKETSSRLPQILSQLLGFGHIFSNRQKSQSLQEQKSKQSKLTRNCKGQEEAQLLSWPQLQSDQQSSAHIGKLKNI